MSRSPTKVTVAAVQAAPVFLDRDATVAELILSMRGAGDAGAQLVVYPEAIVPGYPDWVWRLPAWSDVEWYRRLHDQAVDIPGSATARLGAAAAEIGAWVVVGVTERVPSGTLYNSLLYLSPRGDVAGVHRKLVLTGGERTVWGNGDSAALTVVETGFGRLGGLICWENLMPLARAALYQEGIDIWVAPTWDNSDAWLSTLRHIAREGRVFVIGTNTCLRGSAIPRDLLGASEIYGGDDDWLSRGNTAIVGPDGTLRGGPLTEETGTVVATIDLAELALARREFDPVGHYARPDMFTLSVNSGRGMRRVTQAEPGRSGVGPTDGVSREGEESIPENQRAALSRNANHNGGGGKERLGGDVGR